jgi:hypothetical protein
LVSATGYCALICHHPDKNFKEITMRVSPSLTLCALLLTAASALPVTALAGEGSLTLEKKASYAKGLKVPDAVRAECGLEQKIPQYVEEFAKKGFDTVVLADGVSAKTKGKALTMKITDLSGTGGGAWSGPKFVNIEGTLWQNGKVAGTFRASRYSSGGAFGGYKGTCGILARCAKALGKDVATWAVAPSMNALLGDAAKK